jgi:WD40 repeat protein
VRTLEGREDSACWSLVYSPDGKILASAGTGTVRLWEVGTGKQIHALEGLKHERRSAAFSADGKTLAVLDGRSIRRWNVTTGDEIRIPEGHQQEVQAIVFSPDGRRLASSELDGSLRLWDPADGKSMAVYPLEPRAKFLTFSRNGRTLAWWNWTDPVRLLDVATGKGRRELKGSEVDQARRYAEFSPDGSTLATTSEKAITLWSVAAGKKIRSLDGPDATILAFSPDGKMLASGTTEKGDPSLIRLWDLATGKQVRTWECQEECLESWVFSPNGKCVAWRSRWNAVHMREVSCG